MTQDARHTRVIYEIQVLGELDPSWEPYFSGLAIASTEVGRVPVTTLTGPVADQPALRGLLCKPLGPEPDVILDPAPTGGLG
ncbi:MAG: hypothetical protein MUF84_14160 [Anaerolineae bacterium]|nr:hypothetical protein [Anaerolineae bacterium]